MKIFTIAQSGLAAPSSVRIVVSRLSHPGKASFGILAFTWRIHAICVLFSVSDGGEASRLPDVIDGKERWGIEAIGKSA